MWGGECAFGDVGVVCRGRVYLFGCLLQSMTCIMPSKQHSMSQLYIIVTVLCCSDLTQGNSSIVTSHAIMTALC